MKKIFFSTILIFVVWQILDFIIHGNLLMEEYAATAQLWRPMEEMSQGLMALVSALLAFFFVWIYHLGFAGKGRKTALKYGVAFGMGVGISMGFGTFTVQPITLTIALGWWLGTVIQTTVAALITAWVYKESA